jgi:hypothetical protein
LTESGPGFQQDFFAIGWPKSVEAQTERNFRFDFCRQS